MPRITSRFEEWVRSLPYVSSFLSWRSFRRLLRSRRDSIVYYEKKRLEYANDKTKTRDDRSYLEMEEGADRQSIDDEIDRARSSRLLEECIEHDLEVPNEPWFWEKTLDGTDTKLTPKARAHLRNLIRDEKSKSSQELARLIPFLTAIGSIIALLIALVSVLKK